jgi:hypothetical protein
MFPLTIRGRSRATQPLELYSTLRIFFRIINDFVQRFILDRTVDFTVSLLILILMISTVKW